MTARYQKVLGLDPSGHYTNEDYKKAYKKMAIKHHPDQGGDEEKFKEVTEAYEVLSGKREFKGYEQPQGFGFGHVHDMYDFFDQMSRRHANFSRRRKPPENEQDINLGLNLSIADIKAGKQFEIEYVKSKKCEKCNGVGGKEKITCNVCRGRGRIVQTQSSGNVSFSTEFPCPACAGAGMDIKEPCENCQANGFVMYKESLKFEVKER